MTEEYASETVRRFFDTSGEHGEIMKAANVPPSMVIIQRINLGLYAILGQLDATANWRRIAEELWPWVGGPPSTPMGEAEAAWRAQRELRSAPRRPAVLVHGRSVRTGSAGAGQRRRLGGLGRVALGGARRGGGASARRARTQDLDERGQQRQQQPPRQMAPGSTWSATRSRHGSVVVGLGLGGGDALGRVVERDELVDPARRAGSRARCRSPGWAWSPAGAAGAARSAPPTTPTVATTAVARQQAGRTAPRRGGRGRPSVRGGSRRRLGSAVGADTVTSDQGTGAA